MPVWSSSGRASTFSCGRVCSGRYFVEISPSEEPHNFSSMICAPLLFGMRPPLPAATWRLQYFNSRVAADTAAAVMANTPVWISGIKSPLALWHCTHVRCAPVITVFGVTIVAVAFCSPAPLGTNAMHTAARTKRPPGQDGSGRLSRRKHSVRNDIYLGTRPSLGVCAWCMKTCSLLLALYTCIVSARRRVGGFLSDSPFYLLPPA